jgi:hypothetical protein
LTEIAATEALPLVTRSDDSTAELAAGTVYMVVSVVAAGISSFLKYLFAMLITRLTQS